VKCNGRVQYSVTSVRALTEWATPVTVLTIASAVYREGLDDGEIDEIDRETEKDSNSANLREPVYRCTSGLQLSTAYPVNSLGSAIEAHWMCLDRLGGVCMDIQHIT